MDSPWLRSGRATVLLLGAAALGCGAPPDTLVFAATTSTYDSGLLERLVSAYRTDHPDVRIRTIVLGSGQALELARRGDADVILVHAPEAEERFVSEGHAVSRARVMYNDFVVAGPAEDPAAVRGLSDPAEALRRIRASGATFLSRGDSSGTHYREIRLWGDAGLQPGGEGYAETGQGQGTTLQVAGERRGYVLTDRATLQQLADIVDVEPLVEGHPTLVNVYSVLVPRATRHEMLATSFAGWLASEAGARVIDDFNAERGETMFTPILPGDPDPSAVPGASSPDSAGAAAPPGTGAPL